MKTYHTPDTLRIFESQIAAAFNAGLIRAPIHLAGGCEEHLIEIFSKVQPEDWVLTQWRSHYHCLLKGVPEEQLRSDILAGRSITLTYPEHRILSSAIVGGILPIGVGIATVIKRRGGTEKVWCFVGDMTATTGIFQECLRYASGHELPVEFIIEDNGLSVCTDTRSVWGKSFMTNVPLLQRHEYLLPWPHSGAGTRVNF